MQAMEYPEMLIMTILTGAVIYAAATGGFDDDE